MPVFEVVILITIGLLCVLAMFFIYIIYSKLVRDYRNKIRARYTEEINGDLDRLLADMDSGNDFLSVYDFAKKSNGKKPHKDIFLLAMETIFMDRIENSEMRRNLIKIAHAMQFPKASLLGIALGCRRAKVRMSSAYLYGALSSRKGNVHLPNNMFFDYSTYKLSAYNMQRGESVLDGIASGCRRAGLYQYEEAIPYMLGALGIMSGETQFQILAALSRIGDVDAVVRAFNIIKDRILVNERAILEIVDSFAGKKHELHKQMLSFRTEYVAAIFIKAMTEDVANDLMEKLLHVVENGSKEMRAAAIKALAKTGSSKIGKHLLRALEDPAWEVRAAAAKALGTCVCAEGGEALSLSLRDSEWWVRQNSATALLSYPNCEELFLKTIRSEWDTYAIQSIVYTLESADRPQLLSRIQDAVVNRQRENTR